MASQSFHRYYLHRFHLSKACIPCVFLFMHTCMRPKYVFLTSKKTFLAFYEQSTKIYTFCIKGDFDIEYFNFKTKSLFLLFTLDYSTLFIYDFCCECIQLPHTTAPIHVLTVPHFNVRVKSNEYNNSSNWLFFFFKFHSLAKYRIHRKIHLLSEQCMYASVCVLSFGCIVDRQKTEINR